VGFSLIGQLRVGESSQLSRRRVLLLASLLPSLAIFFFAFVTYLYPSEESTLSRNRSSYLSLPNVKKEFLGKAIGHVAVALSFLSVLVERLGVSSSGLGDGDVVEESERKIGIGDRVGSEREKERERRGGSQRDASVNESSSTKERPTRRRC